MRRETLFALTLVALLVARGSVAQESPAQALRAPAARTEVLFGVRGKFAAEDRAALVSLLGSELQTMGLALAERDPKGGSALWAREATASDARLLAVLLDNENGGGFRLVIIDVARQRAISRELSPDMQANRANIEAVVSIVTSAASALGEGLEVASAPVESVVGAGDPKPESVPPPAPAPPAPPSRAREPFSPSVHGGIAFAWGSLSDAPARSTAGAVLTLGVTPLRFLTVEGSAGRHFPREIATELGRFDLVRTNAGLYVGAPIREHRFTLTPELGATLEWLERSNTEAALGVSASNGRTFQRWGACGVFRARYRLVGPLALGGALNLTFFGRRISFQSGSREVAEANTTVATLELGLVLASD